LLKLSITCANAVYHWLVSDGQTEVKVSVTHKSWLSRNNRKTYCNIFAASAKLAYGQQSQETKIKLAVIASSRHFRAWRG